MPPWSWSIPLLRHRCQSEIAVDRFRSPVPQPAPPDHRGALLERPDSPSRSSAGSSRRSRAFRSSSSRSVRAGVARRDRHGAWARRLRQRRVYSQSERRRSRRRAMPPIVSTCAPAAAPSIFARRCTMPASPAIFSPFVRQLGAPAFLVGFSLGRQRRPEAGRRAWRRAPRNSSTGVCGVSTPLDLAACARRIAEPENRLYEARFVRRMRARLCATGRYSARDFAGLRSVMDLDDRITAPVVRLRQCGELLPNAVGDRLPGRDSRPGAADPGEGRHVHSVRDLRVGRGAVQPAHRVAGDRARRPSRLPRTAPAPFMGGSRDNGMDPSQLLRSRRSETSRF